MKTRRMMPQDLPRIQELFKAQGFDYDLPDFNEEQFVVKHVLVDEHGVVRQAAIARRTVELYLLVDETWETPGWRFQGLKMIHESVRKTLERMGFQDVHSWLPPKIAKKFSSRLMRSFGWAKPLWEDVTRNVKAVS